MKASDTAYNKLNKVLLRLPPATRMEILAKEYALFNDWKVVLGELARITTNAASYSQKEADALITLVEEAAKKHLNDLLSLGEGVVGCGRKERRAINAIYVEYASEVVQTLGMWAKNVRIVNTSAAGATERASDIASQELSDLL